MATTYDKASLVMIPSGYKDDKLYSVKPTDGSGDFTFSRDGAGASPATRVNASGLIEKGRENVLLQSNQFDTTWTLDTGMTLTSGQTGYDGSSDAWLLQRNAAFDYLRQDNTNSGVQTFSVYAKAGSLDFVLLRFLDGGGYNGQYFDLSNGTLGTTDGSLIDSNITSIGSGWYRCDVTINTTLQRVWIYPVPSDNGVGDATAGNIYIQDAQLEQGLVATDYIETTTAAVSAGLLGDMPRLDYSGGATCPSLLLEPSRVNLFEQSEYFGGTYWGKTSDGSGIAPVVTQNYAVSPEGVQNATRVQFDTNGTAPTDRSGLVRDFAFTTGDKYAISCWVKSASGSDEIFTFRIAGAQVGGEKIATSEWQLFTETHTATATTTDNFGIQIRGNYSSQTSDILIYGMQLESGVSYPTSYIPTYGSASTRGADSNVVLTGVSDLIGQTEGTIFVDTTSNTEQDGDGRIQLSDGTSTNNWIFLGAPEPSGSGVKGRAYITNAGAVQVNSYGSLLTAGRHKFALAYKENDVVLYVDGALALSDTSATIPTCDRITISGAAPSSTNMVRTNKHHQIALFKTRLTNAELAALTTI